MQLNKATDYAFRAVLYMATLPPGAVAGSRELAEKQAIPPRFVLKIMHLLIKAGLVVSRRGAEGGFSLARPAAEVSLLDVITAMEGRVALHQCLADREACNRHCVDECPVHRRLAEMQAALEAGLKAANFAELARGN